ncbi:hypothetical protein M758_11G008300 [Ceratodon purpureus]|nr:hypothetical protein M758_11G008300 [Ceratodon purpureus]
MAVSATCVGSLLPRISLSVPCRGLDELGSLQLVFGGKSAVKGGRSKSRTGGLCRAAQSSSPSSQRHVIITGGNTGIGKATATELARLGMSVTIACRNLEKGEQAVADIIRASNSSSVRVMELDLASFASIRQFAAEYLDSGLPLNSLVNNAGVMACPLQYTVDGYEYQLGVNHLGHFLLTALLLDKLVTCASPGAQSRVVVLASAAERIGNIDFADLNYKTRKYNEWQAYGQSKLANCLFSHELARRCKSLNIPVTSNCMHPGVVDTELARYILPQSMSKNLPSIPGLRPVVTKLLGLKTPEEGASTAVYLANAYEMEGKTGGYYESSRKVNPSARAVNSKLSYSLWAVSEDLTGTTEDLEPLRLSVRTESLLNA